ncbi:acyl-CoA dehydrogenase family protein [Alcaligenaceae bacterium]|nr:acyl-CoA dehydrogenase family protein [Alcaligenaceae bacterium]
MDFTYNDEQRMLADSLRKLVADNWSFDARRARAANPELDRLAWQSLADLGVTGLLVPEASGGFGEGANTLLVTQLELGRSLVAEPIIPSAVICTTVLAQSDNPAIVDTCLGQMADGTLVCALAYLEGSQRNSLTPVETRAEQSASGYTISGAKKLVWGGAQADRLIVSALLNDALALFLVPADAQGVAVTDFPTMDGYRCANVVLNGVVLPDDALIAVGEDAEKALELGLDFGVAALCAHAAGAMETLVQTTVEYLKTRRQFGRPLVDFQALQHKLAEMLVWQEHGMSMAYVAARGLAEHDAGDRARQVSAAKVAIAEAGRFIGEHAVQLHGGIGVTRELDVGDYFKWLTYVSYLLGSTDYHLTRVEQQVFAA